MSMSDYIKLIKFRYHGSFVGVVIPALYFSDMPLLQLLKLLAVLYLSFNVLLYGGLYTINDIADMKPDARHPVKRHRPLPSQRVSLKAAVLFALTFIALAFVSGYFFFGKPIVYLFGDFVVINLFYTFFAKNIPYLELLANTVPQMLRPVMAVVITSDRSVPYLFVLASFFLFLGFICVRRVVEKDVAGWESRRVLTRYVNSNLLWIQIASFVAILFLYVLDKAQFKTLYAFMVAIYLIFIFGSYTSEGIRSYWRSMLTR